MALVGVAVAPDRCLLLLKEEERPTRRQQQNHYYPCAPSDHASLASGVPANSKPRLRR